VGRGPGSNAPRGSWELMGRQLLGLTARTHGLGGPDPLPCLGTARRQARLVPRAFLGAAPMAKEAWLGPELGSWRGAGFK